MVTYDLSHMDTQYQHYCLIVLAQGREHIISLTRHLTP